MRELLFPESAALVGVSQKTPQESIANAGGGGIRAVAIHPRETSAGGLQVFRRIADAPFVPEVAWLLVGHRTVEAAFEEAVAAGVRAFILPGLGNEAGAEGRPVAERIAARAREVGARVIGPNCMGTAVPGGPSFWIGTIPATFVPGHVATVVQSGSIGEALVNLGPRVGFRCVVSSGGELVTDVADLCSFFARDEGTRAVGLFLETVRRPQKFMGALEELARAGKPVACLKVGRSPGGARAVLAHSGALVGSDEAFAAMLRAYGVIHVDDFPELVEVLEVLGKQRRPKGTRIGGVTNSGGEGALLADHAEAAGIPFAPLSAALAKRLSGAFPNYLTPQNPVDAWAVDEVERVFPGTLQLLAGSGEFDILVAQVDQSQFLGAAEVEDDLLITGALADAVEGTGIFPAVTSVQVNDPPPDVARLARERDVAMLRGSRNGIHALAAVAAWRPLHPPPRTRGGVDLSDMLRAGPMPELESGAVLERYGIPVAARRRAGSPEAAGAAATEVGFPVVVKRDGPAHKSRSGGVIVGVRDAEAARAAAESLGGSVLVAAQRFGSREVYCGMTRDPDFGPVIALGVGGAGVESQAGAVACLGPLGLDEARRLVMQAAATRTASTAAIEAVAKVVVAVGDLAADHPEITAVDINPLIVDDDGAVAVDALVVVAGGES